jgi:hypothetical protein
MIRLTTATLFLTVFTLLIVSSACAQSQENPDWDPNLTNDWTPVEDSVYTDGYRQPPSDAIILFDGSDLSQWQSAPGYFIDADAVSEYLDQIDGDFGEAGWTVEDGIMTVNPGTGNIMTKQRFGDMQLHIEWRTPAEIEGEGQGRGNSGVFLMGLYEVQVLDSWQNRTYSNGQAGALYKQYSPMVNASKRPGEWQTYDIFFERPHFGDDGSVIKPAQVTVLHNGVMIHHKRELRGPTVYMGLPEYVEHPDEMPIGLQDHSNPVSFRNIWVREL